MENTVVATTQQNALPEVKKKKEKRSVSFLVAKIVVFVLFAVYAFTLFYAMIYACSLALKTQFEYEDSLVGLPKSWKFSNFAKAFTAVQANDKNMFSMFLNSLWYAVGGAVLGAATSAVVAYIVSKYKFPGRKIFYGMALVCMMIPIVGSFPSQYRVYNTLHILDTPFLLVTKMAGFGFNFIVLYSFFKTLSWTYAEAGFIDGASHLRVFVKIMLPMALPVMGSLFLVQMVQLWNEYMEPNLFLQSYPTLAAGLFIFQLYMTRQMNYPMLFAGLIVSVLPVIVLFILFQKVMMESMSVGGIKG
ncbi:MAG: carbohydrate ABC transporter permease [Clostridiales bacterium]|nr:carbohydrate ABC transporter permease [Clostridiales bacterium]